MAGFRGRHCCTAETNGKVQHLVNWFRWCRRIERTLYMVATIFICLHVSAACASIQATLLLRSTSRMCLKCIVNHMNQCRLSSKPMPATVTEVPAKTRSRIYAITSANETLTACIPQIHCAYLKYRPFFFLLKNKFIALSI